MRNVDLFNREILSGSVADLHETVLDLELSQSAFFCNVHMLMLSQENSVLARAMDRAQMVFPDGAPIAWLQRRMGYSQSHVLRGYEAVEILCADAAANNDRIGLYGSTDFVLDALVMQLSYRFPGLQIEFVTSPRQFSVSEIALEKSLVSEINAKNLRYLFVGLGCPKQEIWIDRYADELNCSLLGVGAAFDWLAGTTSKPPGWMEKAGLAWLFRLIQNPGGMWHRYLIYNSKFIFQSLKLLILNRQSLPRESNR